MRTDNSQENPKRPPLEALIKEAINSGCVIEMANIIRKVMAVNGSIVFSPNNFAQLECIPRVNVLSLIVEALDQNKSLTQNARFMSMLFRSPLMRRDENRYPATLGRFICLTYDRQNKASLFELLDIASEMKTKTYSLFDNKDISKITVAYQKLKNAILCPSLLSTKNELQTALLLFLNTDLKFFVDYMNDIVIGVIPNPYSATQWQTFKDAFLSCPFEVDMTEKKQVNLPSLIEKLNQYKHPSLLSANSSSAISTLTDEDKKRLEKYADEAMSVFQGEKARCLTSQQLRNCQAFILGSENDNAAQADTNQDAELLLTNLNSRFQYYCQRDSKVNGLTEQNHKLGIEFYRAQCAFRLHQFFPEHLSIIKTEESYEAAYAVLEYYFSSLNFTSQYPEKITALDNSSNAEYYEKAIDKWVLRTISQDNFYYFKKFFRLFLETSQAGREFNIDIFSPDSHEDIIKEAICKNRNNIVGYLINHPESLSKLLSIGTRETDSFTDSPLGQILSSQYLRVYIAKILRAHPGRAGNSPQYLSLLQEVIDSLSRSLIASGDMSTYIDIAEKSYYERVQKWYKPVFQETTRYIISSIEPLLKVISKEKQLKQLMILTQFSLLLITVDENQEKSQDLQNILQLIKTCAEQLDEPDLSFEYNFKCINHFACYKKPTYAKRNKYPKLYEEIPQLAYRYLRFFRKLFHVAIQSKNVPVANALLNISEIIGIDLDSSIHYQVAYQRGKLNEVLFLRSIFQHKVMLLLPLLFSVPKMNQIGQFSEQKKFILSLFSVKDIQFVCPNHWCYGHNPIYQSFDCGYYENSDEISEHFVTIIELFLKQNKQIGSLCRLFDEVDERSSYDHTWRIFRPIRNKLKQRLGKKMFSAILSHKEFITQQHHKEIFNRASRNIVGKISIPNLSKIETDLATLSEMTSHLSPEFIDYAKKYHKLLMLIEKMSSIFTSKNSLYHAVLDFINTSDFALEFIAPDEDKTLNGIKTRVYTDRHPCLVFKEFMVVFFESLQQKQASLTETEKTFQTKLIVLIQQQTEYNPGLLQCETRRSIASLASSHQQFMVKSSQEKAQEEDNEEVTVATDSAESTVGAESAEGHSDTNQKIALSEQQKTELKTFAVTWSNQFGNETIENLIALLVYVESKPVADQHLFGQQQKQKRKALKLMTTADSGSDFTQFMNREQNMPYGITQTQIPEAKEVFKYCVAERLKELREDVEKAEERLDLLDRAPEVPVSESASNSETSTSTKRSVSAHAKELRTERMGGATMR